MTDWYTYPWELRGVSAQFRVDPAYSTDPMLWQQRTTLICLTCQTRRKAGKDFSFWERRRLDPVLHKACRVLGEQTVHVGCIDLPGQRVHYFYTSDARLLVPLYSFCSKETTLSLSCTKAEEPNRQTYYRLLLPDAAKIMSQDNLAFIDSYRQRGDKLNAARRIHFHFCLPNTESKTAFESDAVSSGFSIGRTDTNPASDYPCSITLNATAPLSHRELTRLTTSAIRLADQYDGLFDRMEAEFIGKR